MSSNGQNHVFLATDLPRFCRDAVWMIGLAGLALLIVTGCATSTSDEHQSRTGEQPPTDSAVADSDRPLVIRIDANGGIGIGRKAYAMDELPDLLQRVARANLEREVVIRADAEAPTDVPDAVFARCRAAGLRAVHIAYQVNQREDDGLPAHLSR